MADEARAEGPEHHTARWTRNGAIFNGMLAITNVVVAILIAGQLYFLKRQVQDASTIADTASKQGEQSIYIAKKSLEESQSSNRSQLRPWLSADVAKNFNLLSDDISAWKMSVVFENVGRTPATKMDLYGALELHEFPLSSSTRIALLDPSMDAGSSNKVLLPGAKTTAPIGFRSGEAPKSFSKFKDGKLAVFAVGHVSYLAGC